jgi:hypothetical protein
MRKALIAFAAIGVLAVCSVFALAAPSFAAGGQTGMLSGRIVDASSAPISGADVTISAPTGRYTAHTDGKGRFRIIGADVDTYTLNVKKDGYTGVSQAGIAVLGDQTVDLGVITLQRSS